jgi:hypothetical protein
VIASRDAHKRSAAVAERSASDRFRFSTRAQCSPAEACGTVRGTCGTAFATRASITGASAVIAGTERMVREQIDLPSAILFRDGYEPTRSRFAQIRDRNTRSGRRDECTTRRNGGGRDVNTAHRRVAQNSASATGVTPREKIVLRGERFETRGEQFSSSREQKFCEGKSADDEVNRRTCQRNNFFAGDAPRDATGTIFTPPQRSFRRPRRSSSRLERPTRPPDYAGRAAERRSRDRKTKCRGDTRFRISELPRRVT